jgi:hypothetical protein
MFKRKRPLRPSQIDELNRLMSSPVPAEVIAQLSAPVARALLLHFVLEARYGND